MARRLTWTNNSTDYDGTNVYRDTTIDPQNLPEPIATVDPVAQGATVEYIDLTGSGDQCYAVRDFDSSGDGALSEAYCYEEDLFADAQIGDEIGGGIYAGMITYADARQFHIVAGPASSEVRDIHWKTTETSTSGTVDDDDGMSNSDSMVTVGIDDHPAAKHCVNYTGGGNEDWYMPSINEMQLLLDNLVNHAEFADLVASEQFSYSSTENSGTRAKGVWFSSPETSVNPFKSRDGSSVRPIRRVPV